MSIVRSLPQPEQGSSVMNNISHSNDENLRGVVQALVDSQNTMTTLVNSMAQTQISSASSPLSLRHSSSRHEMRLPTIQIPEFDGQTLEWLRFRDLFESMVAARTNISNVEKLEYLQTKLKGDALSIIKHLKTTNDNYQVAWDLLKAKYDHSEKIKKTYLKLLVEHQCLKTESAAELQKFYNQLNESYNALKVLEMPVEHWDAILLYLLDKKLDDKTLALWVREKSQDEATTFQQFLKFLDKRIYELEGSIDVVQHVTQLNKQGRYQARTFTTLVQSCPMCKMDHHIYACEAFKKLTYERKRELIKEHKLCFNCLQGNHRYSECKSSSCRKCGQKHNTLLHPSGDGQPHSQHQATFNRSIGRYLEKQTPSAQNVSVNMSQRQNRPYVLLPTAIVHVKNKFGIAQPCRALLDSGSQCTLISEDCAQRLKLDRTHDKTVLYGINANQGTHSRGKLIINICTDGDNHKITTEALCLARLTQTLPAQQITDDKLEYFAQLTLADKNYKRPGKVDIVLGADVFMQCCLTNKLVHPSGTPTAMETIFGWVLMGETNEQKIETIMSYHVINLDDQLQKFWDIEEIPNSSHQFTPEEEAAEAHYKKTTTRQEDGRYVVRLPFKNNEIDLGDSKTIAEKRWINMERKCKFQPKLDKEYKEFMNQYIELGHMEKSKQQNTTHGCFLPHHAVFKDSSTTTKVRIVFDASCQTTNGRSLNDNLLTGAKQQNDLFDILIKFRKYEIGFTGDIEKMYRQIIIHQEDRDFQKILWRNTEKEKLTSYELTTVTYGTAAAPFLATRTLKEVAKTNQETFPVAAKIINENFYVDDLMGCAMDLKSAIQNKNDVTKILEEAGFHLRKWSSNKNTFLDTIPAEDRETAMESIIDQETTVNILGLKWNTKEDNFKYSVTLPNISHVATKRTVLSEISKIYDPVGWLAPVVIRFKIFMQRLWLKGINWDEQLPETLYKQWATYRATIDTIKYLKIPRWIQYTNDTKIELHGFADASELAYAAVIYMKVQNNEGIKVNLIAAKTRVAPIKQVSLPRLELCAAQLMVKLMTIVKSALDIPNVEVYGWSDSTIVLAWLSDFPRRWKSFIANRTSYIINIIPAQQWRHIRSQDNPADIASRGIDAAQLLNNKLWWYGPNILQAAMTSRSNIPIVAENIDLEERKEQLTFTTTKQEMHIMHNYSNFTQLTRTLAWIYRFIKNCQTKKSNNLPKTKFLTTMELNDAHQQLIKQAQFEIYKPEIDMLTKGKQLSNNHKLTPLTPFLDNQGILRVGGRVEHANITFNQKHPMIMHKEHHLTKLIVHHYHQQYMHAGNRLLHCILGLRYWIPGIKQTIKQCIYKCPKCMRQKAQPFNQQMGNLPQCRFNVSTAFNNVGIDYAGPLQVRAWKGRGNKTHKTWIAVFVCLVTKAIHIELVTELTTTAFVAALRRFVSRRGRPNHIYTDNGTNFVGACRYLQDLNEFLNKSTTQDVIAKELSQQNINWHFSPPSSPHFGGIWEAGVKSIKQHLKRVLSESLLTYEELSTVLCQIEACLNSRPLCLTSEEDINPLTPAHFLILRPMTAIIEEDCTQIKENCLKRWNYVQRLVQGFWKRWSLEYIHQLQQKRKWTNKQNNIKLGTIVLIKDESAPPAQWQLGKVIKVHPGLDNLIRVVTLKTAKGEIKRPIVKLCPLIVEIEERNLQGGPECLAAQ